ncbi:MAG: DUF885 domain-containing protein [Acidobacteria bacterium]|nr:DUF885 domain-containing protein [Acidobacteriota bacterium]
MDKMTRREAILALTSALATGGATAKAALQTVSGAGQTPPGAPAPPAGVKPASQPGPPSQADQAFRGFVSHYFDGFFHFNPARATKAGIHQYDAQLPAYSSADIRAEIARNQRALTELGKIPNDALSANNQFDARLLGSLIQGHLLDLASIRMWAKNPNFYNDIASESLFALVERDFAPLDDRLKSLISRAERIPDVLNSARANVVNPPSVYTAVAIEQVQAQISYIQNALPQVVAGATSGSLKTEFNTVNQQLVTAYNQFLNYLKNVLTPQSQGAFAIGAGNFSKKLLYDEMVDTPADQLLKIGQSELQRNQSLFAQTAQVIDKTKSPQEILQSMAQEHPAANQVLSDAQSVVDSQRQFVLTHEIVTVAPAPIPQVKEAPAFMEAKTLACLDTPGPLEQHSIQSFYYLTLPNSGWNQAQKEQLVQLLDTYATQIISLREAYPGHYVQFLWLKSAPPKARKLEPSLKVVETNWEGWAHYCEEMMLEQGYGEGDPKLLLAQLQAALVRLCRYIAAIRMHTGGMTVDEAASLFQSQAYLDPASAQREAIRGALDPGYLSAALGKLEIMKLREDSNQNLGEKFNLRQFHNQFLGFGIAPVKMIREQIMGDNSPVL